MPSPVAGQVTKAFREGVRFTRSLMNSSVESTAKKLRSEAVALRKTRISIPESDGYVKFDTASIGGGSESVAQVASLCKDWTKDPVRTKYDKLFPYNLARSEDLLEQPAFLKLALHDDVLASVSEYLGQVPRLYNLYMWWTPPNDTVERSQLYHYDHRDSRQAKVFICISDVTPEAGPLHFLTASDSLIVDKSVGYSQDRYEDTDVYRAVPKSRELQALGKAGEAYIVDTARCLHFGSRGNKVDRLILMASFARANSVEPGSGCRVLDPVRETLIANLYGKDPVRSFVLTKPT